MTSYSNMKTKLNKKKSMIEKRRPKKPCTTVIYLYIFFCFCFLARACCNTNNGRESFQTNKQKTQNNPTIQNHAHKTAGHTSRPLLLCSHAHPNNVESSSHCQLHTTQNTKPFDCCYLINDIDEHKFNLVHFS